MKKLDFSKCTRAISFEERMHYAKLSREQALELPDVQKIRYFYVIQVRHRELLNVQERILRYISPDTDTRILTLIGPPGAGKTSFSENVLANNLRAGGIGERPFLMVSTPAHGSNKVAWSGMYIKILQSGGEPLIGYSV